MERYTGKSIVKGIAIGRILFYSKGENPVVRGKVEDCAAEIERYEAAKAQAAKELDRLFQKALKEVGEVNAAVFEVHAMMLEDEDFNDSVRNIINSQQVNAEYAVAATGDNFSRMFSEMEDDYFQARAADVKDISERLVSVLEGKERSGYLGGEPVIVAAHDLAPSETVQMDKEKLLAFVTEYGSANSHTAILARTMNIPALIGVPIQKEWNGKLAIVDGYSGTLYLEPGEKILKLMRVKMEEDERSAELLQQLKGKESVTKDGKKVQLYANIGSVSDMVSVFANDAEGIGLFRSEFLYLEKEDYPTEEELFQAYKSVAEMMAGKKVIIRTLDIGADKQVEYFHMEKEENPAMGYRAIRLCLDRPAVFKTQLRAIFRASVFGNVSVMYPMIISVDEVRKIKELVEEVKKELRAEDIAYKDIEQGIMIETPAAALISDLLASEVDFFSVGTNDLTQYTLAIDRQNAKLDAHYDAHHPAVLRMLRMVVENGHKGGCWVGICGELGADISLTEEFLRMGVDELSVSPSRVLSVRKEIRRSDLSVPKTDKNA
ncbi:phosphoenolpyruvate--protein phosphotransferase [Qiania dongpingensis]|uniref:Phosphoenolpyruvate-protein phosphotransferase n=1 Tax=Qiania dongpingensis TaxID=2763669 RepID=A0A7G9G626_9FIRM|nr:phosphoenolpyruvate--protein phosphotransferase [Qiania dongpingensis]QNM06258.1 phosphoenolpyruvate--protein phosphotransferase [Qiania dongpingensis]